jgi:hypothetical protein
LSCRLYHISDKKNVVPRYQNLPCNIEIKDLELRINRAQSWLDNLCDALQSDSYFAQIVTILERNLPNLKDLPTRDAKSWHKLIVRSVHLSLEDRLLYRGEDSRTQGTHLCILISLTSEVLEVAHDTPSEGGHPGVERMLSTIGI